MTEARERYYLDLIAAANIAITVLRDDCDRRVHEAETRAAVTEAHNVTLQAALKRTQHEARRWRAAAEAAIGHRNAIEEELAAAKQELRALHAGKAGVA